MLNVLLQNGSLQQSCSVRGAIKQVAYASKSAHPVVAPDQSRTRYLLLPPQKQHELLQCHILQQRRQPRDVRHARNQITKICKAGDTVIHACTQCRTLADAPEHLTCFEHVLVCIICSDGDCLRTIVECKRHQRPSSDAQPLSSETAQTLHVAARG